VLKNNLQKKITLLSLLLLSLKLVFPKIALAMCPVCTIAVGAGLGLSRFLGIDDTISGLWIGGLIISSSFWLADYLKKKKLDFKYEKEIITFLSFTLVIIPLWLSEIIGHPLNKIFGIDKLVFGTFVGAVVFYEATLLDKFTRKIFGKQLFNFQKIVFPIFSLALISVIFYLLIGRK